MSQEFATRITGIAYHSGHIRGITYGDRLRIVRDPQNPHDRNAIRVELADGVMLGYIPRQDALALAPLIDSHAGAYAIAQSTMSGRAESRRSSIRKRGSSTQRGVRSPRRHWDIKVHVVDNTSEIPQFPSPAPQPRPAPPAIQPKPVVSISPPAAPKLQKSNPACFVATAVFEDFEHPSVLQLRIWRDRVLLPSRLGRHLVDVYYRIGPGLAAGIRFVPWLKPPSAKLLRHLAAYLSSRL